MISNLLPTKKELPIMKVKLRTIFVPIEDGTILDDGNSCNESKKNQRRKKGRSLVYSNT